MKKLFKMLPILFTSMFCLTACNEIYSYPLEKIKVTSYVKEEAHVSGAMIFFCIFGSYTKSSTTVQRYIFLAKNGPRDSYKINDIHVYPTHNHNNNEYVYFNYIEDEENSYLEYQYDYGSGDHNYWLHLPKDTVLELASDMFRDM